MSAWSRTGPGGPLQALRLRCSSVADLAATCPALAACGAVGPSSGEIVRFAPVRIESGPL